MLFFVAINGAIYFRNKIAKQNPRDATEIFIPMFVAAHCYLRATRYRNIRASKQEYDRRCRAAQT